MVRRFDGGWRGVYISAVAGGFCSVHVMSWWWERLWWPRECDWRCNAARRHCPSLFLWLCAVWTLCVVCSSTDTAATNIPANTRCVNHHFSPAPYFFFFPFFSLRRAASSNLSLLPFSLSLSSRRFCSGLNTQVAPKRHVSRPFAQHPIRIRHCLTVCKHADLSAVAAFLFGSCFFILVLFFRYPMSTHNSTPRSINFVATFRLFISTFNLLWQCKAVEIFTSPNLISPFFIIF